MCCPGISEVPVTTRYRFYQNTFAPDCGLYCIVTGNYYRDAKGDRISSCIFGLLPGDVSRRVAVFDPCNWICNSSIGGGNVIIGKKYTGTYPYRYCIDDGIPVAPANKKRPVNPGENCSSLGALCRNTKIWRSVYFQKPAGKTPGRENLQHYWKRCPA